MNDQVKIKIRRIRKSALADLRMPGSSKKAKSQKEIKELKEELIDAMFPIICIANREGINLQKAWEERMATRLYGRDKNRFEKKSEL